MKKLMVKLRPNQCPVCGGELSLTEVEKTTFSLDDNGARENYFEQGYYDAYLECDTCHEKFEADKKGEFFFVKRSLPMVEKKSNVILSFNPFMKYGA